MKSIITFSFIFMIYFAMPVVSLPYKVSPALLDELALNLNTYQEQPSSNAVIFDLAMSYAYTGQVDKGWELLKTIPLDYSEVVISKYTAKIQTNPKNWKNYFKLAFGYYFNKQVSLSIQQFQNVIELDPENVWAYGFIALIYNEQDQPNQAIDFCKKALAIEEDATAIYALQGLAYLKKKRLFKAYQSYRKFKKLYAQH